MDLDRPHGAAEVVVLGVVVAGLLPGLDVGLLVVVEVRVGVLGAVELGLHGVEAAEGVVDEGHGGGGREGVGDRSMRVHSDSRMSTE